MKWSQLFAPTLREAPKDAEIVSHQLMLRAGLMRKLGSGLYSMLPLGLRSLRKFSQIVREEMDAIGAQEVSLPMVTPADLWKQSGRWEKYGKELLRVQDRHEHEYCLGPTHEEVITQLVASNLKSYRDFPVTLYQIQSKFRDEIRPRFGMMRGREFVMKDAYSFHTSSKDLDKTYEDMRRAYTRIFERCGLRFKVVDADCGSIGGSASAEFMVLSDTGEDLVVECDSCQYAANLEAAECLLEESKTQFESSSDQDMQKFHTPGIKTINDLAQFTSLSSSQLVKTLVYVADKENVLVLLRGDHELNEHKLKRLLGCDFLELASESSILELMGAHPGSLGPVGLKPPIKIISDHSVMAISSVIVGANEDDFHLKNVVPGKDFKADRIEDLRLACPGDVCARCKSGKYVFVRGIEVGHIFKLGDIYSKAMNCLYQDPQGKDQVVTMGCYGIGIGRTIAASIEQKHDELGVVWPKALAPLHVSLILTSVKDEELQKVAESLYDECRSAGIEVIFDDRDLSAGVKFKDSDLIGFPIRIVVGGRFKESGQVEVKLRHEKEARQYSRSEIVKTIEELLAEWA